MDKHKFQFQTIPCLFKHPHIKKKKLLSDFASPVPQIYILQLILQWLLQRQRLASLIRVTYRNRIICGIFFFIFNAHSLFSPQG